MWPLLLVDLIGVNRTASPANVIQPAGRTSPINGDGCARSPDGHDGVVKLRQTEHPPIPLRAVVEVTRALRFLVESAVKLDKFLERSRMGKPDSKY